MLFFRPCPRWQVLGVFFSRVKRTKNERSFDRAGPNLVALRGCQEKRKRVPVKSGTCQRPLPLIPLLSLPLGFTCLSRLFPSLRSLLLNSPLSPPLRHPVVEFDYCLLEPRSAARKALSSSAASVRGASPSDTLCASRIYLCFERSSNRIHSQGCLTFWDLALTWRVPAPRPPLLVPAGL